MRDRRTFSALVGGGLLLVLSLAHDVEHAGVAGRPAAGARASSASPCSRSSPTGRAAAIASCGSSPTSGRCRRWRTRGRARSRSSPTERGNGGRQLLLASLPYGDAHRGGRGALSARQPAARGGGADRVGLRRRGHLAARRAGPDAAHADDGAELRRRAAHRSALQRARRRALPARPAAPLRRRPRAGARRLQRGTRRGAPLPRRAAVPRDAPATSSAC